MTLNFNSYVKNLTEILNGVCVTDEHGKEIPVNNAIEKVVEMMITIKIAGKKVMLVGNGGSSAIASHGQNDFCKACNIKALTFHETSVLTAFTNDINYESAFSLQVEMWAEKGDMLVAISSSGQSENILNAANEANQKGCHVVSLSGFNSDNKLRSLGQINFYVPSLSYGCVELSHDIILHSISDFVMSAANKTD